jgi:hypothetical protein
MWTRFLYEQKHGQMIEKNTEVVNEVGMEEKKQRTRPDLQYIVFPPRRSLSNGQIILFPFS